MDQPLWFGWDTKLQQKFIQVFLVLKNQLNGVDNLMAIENSLWYFVATLKPTNMVLMWTLYRLRPLQHHSGVLKHKNMATPYLTLSNGFNAKATFYNFNIPNKNFTVHFHIFKSLERFISFKETPSQGGNFFSFQITNCTSACNCISKGCLLN